jgi:hypothetical protein
MTDDRLDTRIRGLVVELVDTTPPPPPWESIQARLSGSTETDTAPAGTAPIDTEPGDTRLRSDAPGAIPEPLTEPDDRLPTYIGAEESRKPRWRPIAGAVGAVGVLVGGTFAYSNLVTDDGAPTPEAAVEQFIEAVADEDVIGALESLPPSERELLADAFADLSTEAERLGFTQGLDLGDVGGFDIEIDGLTLRTEQLAQGVAAVHVDGTLTSSSTGAELPLGEAIRDTLLDADTLASFDQTVDSMDQVFADQDVFVVAIEEDGGWHASAWYTIAEYIRRNADEPLPHFGATSIAPVGAASPEEAVRALVEGVPEYDWNRVFGVALPGESRVLYDYGPLVVAAAGESPWDQIDITVDSIDLDVEGDGPIRTVAIRGYDYSSSTTVEGGVQTDRVRFDGQCFETSFTSPYADPPGSTQINRSCRDEEIASGDTTATEWDLNTTARLVVVQQDGRWFISPVRSVAASVLASARQIPDAASARQLLEDTDGNALFSLFPGSLYNLFGFGTYPLRYEREEVFEATEAPVEATTSVPTTAVSTESFETQPTPTTSPEGGE